MFGTIGETIYDGNTHTDFLSEQCQWQDTSIKDIINNPLFGDEYYKTAINNIIASINEKYSICPIVEELRAEKIIRILKTKGLNDDFRIDIVNVIVLYKGMTRKIAIQEQKLPTAILIILDSLIRSNYFF